MTYFNTLNYFYKTYKIFIGNVDALEKDGVNSSKYKSIRRSENKMVKILAKLKNKNFLKFRSKNLFRFKKFQNASTIEELNFLSPNTRVAFI